MCIEHNASTHYTHHKQNVYCYVLHSGLAKLRRKKCNLGEIVCLNQWFFVCFVLSNEENFKKNYLYVICTTIFRILEHFVYVLLSQDQKNSEFLVRNQLKIQLKKARSTLDFIHFLPLACFALKKVSPNMAKNEENLYSTTSTKVARVA